MKRQIFKSIITLACGVMLTQVAMSQAFVPKDAEIALPARSAKLEANVMMCMPSGLLQQGQTSRGSH